VQADARAREVLTAYRGHLDRLAEQLARKETLERQDLEAILGDLPAGLAGSRRVATGSGSASASATTAHLRTTS
jgi:hypothetical protein